MQWSVHRHRPVRLSVGLPLLAAGLGASAPARAASLELPLDPGESSAVPPIRNWVNDLLQRKLLGAL